MERTACVLHRSEGAGHAADQQRRICEGAKQPTPFLTLGQMLGTLLSMDLREVDLCDRDSYVAGIPHLSLIHISEPTRPY